VDAGEFLIEAPERPAPPPGPAAQDDTELFGWLRWASTGGKVPSFVRALVQAAFRACAADYALLRAVELALLMI
jgi:hypothetical protein